MPVNVSAGRFVSFAQVEAASAAALSMAVATSSRRSPSVTTHDGQLHLVGGRQMHERGFV